MSSTFLRVLLVILFAGAAIAIGNGSASADEWGAWKNSGSSECLFAGTNIITTDSPNLHNVAASNSCATNYSVDVLLKHYDSDGRVLNSCDASFHTNYAQCSLQAETLSGDYWTWEVEIAIGFTTYTFECSNSGGGYYDCYHTDDP